MSDYRTARYDEIMPERVRMAGRIVNRWDPYRRLGTWPTIRWFTDRESWEARDPSLEPKRLSRSEGLRLCGFAEGYWSDGPSLRSRLVRGWHIPPTIWLHTRHADVETVLHELRHLEQRRTGGPAWGSSLAESDARLNASHLATEYDVVLGGRWR